MRLAHIGDVHFRPLARHDEYRRAFEDFCREIKARKVDGVVITGDIIHEKTQRITPEIIDELVWWFTAMANICPIYVTLGNHDGNLTNEARQDAISPIVKALDHPNITLYKKSGVYPCVYTDGNYQENLNFCVFSCFDEDGWQNIKPTDDHINIAVFHGAVAGSQTDVGHMMDGDVELDFFDGYDFTFLGDIHKQQFLTKDKRVAYCGSTLQQDFGESTDRHGFLLWDIRGKDDFDVEFVEIKNRKPYATVTWQGDVQSTIKEACKWPDGSRFRIRAKEPLLEKDIACINHDLAARKKTDYIVFDWDKIVTNEVKVREQIKRNLRDPDALLDLLTQFFGQSTFDLDEWDEIEAILKRHLEELPGKDVARNKKWNIKRIEFSNLFGYGEDNIIDFEKMDGLTGIFGPNRIGKSSLIAAILYGLFGLPDRQVGQGKTQYLINIRKTECKVKVFFNVDGVDYNIQRTTNRTMRNKKTGVTNKVFFESLQDGKWVNKASTNPTKTDAKIQSLIGTIEDFQLTAVAAQDDMKRFLKLRSKERKDIVSRFRDFVVLDELHAKCRDDLSTIKAEMNALSAQNWDEVLKEKSEECSRLDEAIERSVEDQEQLRDRLTGLVAELEKADTGDVVTLEDVKKASIHLGEQQLTLDTYCERRGIREKKLVTLERRLKELTEKREATPIGEYRSLIDKHHKLDKLFDKLGARLEEEHRTLRAKQKTVDKLKTVPCGDDYPTCKYIRDAHEEKGNIDTQVELVKSLQWKVDAHENKLDAIDVRDLRCKILIYDNLVSEESKVMREIAGADVKKFDGKISELDQQIKSLEEQLAEMESQAVEGKDDHVEELQDEIEEAKQIIEAHDEEKMQAARRIGQLDAEILKLNEDKTKYDLISEKFRIYEQLVFAFSKKGLPSQIIKSELPDINDEIATILRGVVDFVVEFEVDDESDKLEVYINYGDSRRPIEVCSGMERVVASMAIRVALLNVSSLPKTNLLILDEAFNSLDEKNIDAAARMFSSLKRWFKAVLIVSHDDSVKNIADNQIEISKRGKDAHIYYA